MLHLNTDQVDASVALNAYALYKGAKYSEAIPVLQSILDVESQNWQARLFLGVCFFYTGQPMAAERALRFVYEKCTDAELRQKACFAIQSIKAQLQSKSSESEFSGLAERSPRIGQSLEAIVGG